MGGEGVEILGECQTHQGVSILGGGGVEILGGYVKIILFVNPILSGDLNSQINSFVRLKEEEERKREELRRGTSKMIENLRQSIIEKQKEVCSNANDVVEFDDK